MKQKSHYTESTPPQMLTSTPVNSCKRILESCMLKCPFTPTNQTGPKVWSANSHHLQVFLSVYTRTLQCGWWVWKGISIHEIPSIPGTEYIYIYIYAVPGILYIYIYISIKTSNCILQIREYIYISIKTDKTSYCILQVRE
jgi:hypothetical protein